MQVEICVLGRFTVRCEGIEVDARRFDGRLTRTLIRLLVARQGSVVAREVLVDALWGERAPADPGANLNVLVNRARRALGDPSLIRTVAGGYVLGEGESLVVDARSFAERVALARTRLDHDPAGALASVDEALELWGEPWAEDAYADWARPHRDRLDRAHQECVEIGAAAALRVGQAARAVELARDAVAAAPLREPAHLLLIESLALHGDKAAALAGFLQLRHQLADELGIDPSDAAEQLHARLLRGEIPGLSGPAARAASPFVGRDRELALLRSAGRIALVAGQPGSGKSRLLAEFGARSSGTVITGRAVLPEREYPWSLCRTLLRAVLASGVAPRTVLPARSVHALAELVPELAGPVADSRVDAETSRALILEGAVRLVGAVGGAVLLVDDLQWADASSLELLALLAARSDDLAMVLAFRAGEAPPRFLSDFRTSHRPQEIRLAALDATAIGRLFRDPALARLVVEETDRTPFAVVEVLRAIDGSDAHDVLGFVREVASAGRRRSILHRAERHAEAARDLLGLLAVLGRPASAELLADVTGASIDAVTAQLHELAAGELVSHSERGFATFHDLVAETVRDALEPVHRARLHNLLARALASETAASGERARHLAGAGDRPAAALVYAEGARQRLHQFADQEAERLAEAGLALDPGDAVRADLLEVRAATRARSGQPARAREDLRGALTLASTAPDRARLLTALARVSSGSDDLLRAATLIDLALTEAGDDPATRAGALAAGAIIDMNIDRRARAQRRFDEALGLFEQVGDARGVADILDARAMAVFLDGEIGAAVDALEQVAQLFVDSGNLLRVVTPRATRGHSLIFAGDSEQGLADADEAIELAGGLGYREGVASACWIRSEALTAQDRVDEAIVSAEKALSIASSVGHRGWRATALRGLGIAREAAGDLAAAEDAFRLSVETSTPFPLFACWAHARLALALVALGRLDEAADHVDIALVTGPPMGHYEARLAHCTLAVARGDSDAEDLVDDAVERAAAGGHQASRILLCDLSRYRGSGRAR